jgi:hypothetical protein
MTIPVDTHCPSEQVSVHEAQVRPQLPQLPLSHCVFTQAPLQ